MHVGAPSAPSNLAINLLVTEENELDNTLGLVSR